MYAKQGFDLYLAARNAGELETFANDLRIRTQRTISTHELNILDYSSHQIFYEELEEKPLGVICAAGYLGDQIKAQQDYEEARLIMDSNYAGIVSLLNIIANDFESRRRGFIIGISSVAGDRGRKSNYLYGSAKAALTSYLSGLRNRLHNARIGVLTVKPGFVFTRMTQSMVLPAKLTVQPEQIAEDIFRAQQKNRNVVYSKWVWRWVMLVIKAIPERIFKRMNL